MRNDLVAVLKPHPEHGVGQGLGNSTFKFNDVVFCHASWPVGGERRRAPPKIKHSIMPWFSGVGTNTIALASGCTLTALERLEQDMNKILSFDTLKYANRLKQINVPPEQAELQAEVMKEVLETAFQTAELATKTDVSNAIVLVRKDMEAMEQRLEARIDARDAKIDALEQRLGARIDGSDAKIDALEQRLEARIDASDAKIDAVGQRSNAKIDAVEQRLSIKIDTVEQQLNSRIDAVEQRLNIKIDSVEQRLNSRIDALANKLIIRMTGILVAGIGATAAIVALLPKLFS